MPNYIAVVLGGGEEAGDEGDLRRGRAPWSSTAHGPRIRRWRARAAVLNLRLRLASA